jgi:uncharacterized protein
MNSLPKLPPGPGVPSPCVNVCRMNEVLGLCEGCARTLDEIGAWSLFDDAEKRGVWAELPARQQVLAEWRAAEPPA